MQTLVRHETQPKNIFVFHVRYMTSLSVHFVTLPADDMGLGKTLTMISLVLRQRAEDKTAEADNTSTGSSWLTAGQKGVHCAVFSAFSHSIGICLT